jgi:uncharacterized OB-fold protein
MTTRPVPLPDEVSEPFWRAAAHGELRIQRCRACERLQYPPEITCQRCHNDDLDYTPVSGEASVYSYAEVKRAFHDGFAEELPYLVALVALDEDPTVRLFTNLVDVRPASAQVGMPVTVTFRAVGDAVLPMFRPAGASTGATS